MLDQVKSCIKEYNMITKGDRIVIGVSGGADSVCLFHVLLELKEEYELTLFAVHINHCLRGEEADQDEEYVRNLCLKNNTAFYGIRADVSQISKEKGLSFEEGGRLVRYEEFYRVLKENNCNKIAIAHNKNDNAETFLFHLFRGSGLSGLRGIPPVRDEIIRPLLYVTREEIENYLSLRRIEYCNDATNEENDYSRNKIRNQILSYAKENINSKAIEHITMAGNHIREVNDFLEHHIDKAFTILVKIRQDGSYEIPIAALLQEERVVQRGIIRKLFKILINGLKDIDFLHTELVLSLVDKEVGKRLNLPLGLMAIKEYDKLVLKNESTKEITEKLAERDRNKKEEYISLDLSSIEEGEEKWYEIPFAEANIKIRKLSYKKSMIFPQNGYTKWFDCDKIKNTVLIRPREEGDYLQIDGAGNKKKIKSLFIDEKVPRDLRDGIPLIADGSHIMWVIGHRMSEGYKISEHTRLILEISVYGGNYNG